MFELALAAALAVSPAHLEAIARDAGGRVGLAAEIVETGQHSPIRDLHPEGGFPLTLNELLRYAVSESDGTASDVLLRLAGGAGRVRAWLHTLAIGSAHGVQYRNSATPREAVRLLKALQQGRGLAPARGELLLKWMTETPTGLKRLKGRLPAAAVVAHKTGSSRTLDGVTAATNDIGLATLPGGRHLAIAVFIADASAPDEVRDDTIARLARAVYDDAAR